MDLIYANERFEDIGVLQNYTLDMAYGIDENNFEIKMALQDPPCKPGYYIYIEGTEYGGIIDSGGVDTKENLLIYRGRTWHGLLESKIIEPDTGAAYYNPQGEANEFVADIIERCGLDDIFTVSDEDSGIDIDQIDSSNTGFRFDDVNTGLFCALYYNQAKLIIRCEHGTVMLHVEPSRNYATEEMDSSQLDLSMLQTKFHCNHLICLGQGELSNRAVFHLFTDSGGGVLQYVRDTSTEPIKNIDYIPDLRKEDPSEYPDVNYIATGKDEYAQVFDYRDAAITENYEALMTEPYNWSYAYNLYYEKSEGEGEGEESYTQLERNIQTVYVLTTEKPSNWNSHYNEYFTRSWDSEAGEYVYNEVSVDDSHSSYLLLESRPRDWNKKYSKYFMEKNNRMVAVEKIPEYHLLSKQPDDWKKNYSSYYVTDGVTYTAVSGKSKNDPQLTTTQPSQWAQDWKDYYVKVNGEFKKVENTTIGRRTTAPKWQKNTYYIMGSKTVSPNFSKLGDVYSKKMVVPTWQANRYYDKQVSKDFPAWQANTYYYQDEDVDVGIEFVAGAFYERWEDKYAELIKAGKDKLEELNDTDELNVDLKEDDVTYDIGDIVGGHEEITGTSVFQPVTKKIVKIENDLVTIQYEVK